MDRNTLLLSTMMTSLIIINCCAMDKETTLVTSPHPIILEQGLLTLIPAVVVTLRKEPMFFNKFNCYIKQPIILQSPQTLLNLMHAPGLSTDKNGYYRLPNHLFYPTVIKVRHNNKLENLGSLCKALHKEAKEACRMGQGAFYPMGQGALIYSLNRPFSLDFFKNKRKKIEDMIMSNAQEIVHFDAPRSK